MTNLNQCSIKFKKRPLAQTLEKTTGMSWSFRQINDFDVHVCLKLCVPNKAIIPKLACKPVPTGISPELLNPNYKMVISTNSLLAANSLGFNTVNLISILSSRIKAASPSSSA